MIVSASALSVSKQMSVISDPVSTANPKAVPGSVIQYCILISNSWISNANSVAILDMLPSTQTFVSGSIFTGTTCSNASSGISDSNVNNGTLSMSSINITAGSAYSVVFRVTLN